MRVKKAPSVVSTFAGCGGSSLGYRRAGYRELLAVEWDENACDTFAANFRGVRLHRGDIAKLSGRRALELAGVRRGALDVLDGSPPCQGFSTVGLRRLDDPRNQLFREYVRLLDAFRPKAFVAENVTGLVKGAMKHTFLVMLKALREVGYRVRAAVMNAQYFGVPQSRARVIVIGARQDLGIEPSHPVPASRPTTLRQAIGDLASPGEFARPEGETAEIAAVTLPGEDGRDIRVLRGQKDRDFSLKRLQWNRPCATVPKTVRPKHFSGLLHPDEDRFLGVEELKRVCGFPATFELVGSYEEQWARLGNSVPPPLMEAIARHVRREILRR